MTQYNGWTNYETWVVKLWMDNDPGDYAYWLDEAAEVFNDRDPDNPDDVGDSHILADALRDKHLEQCPIADASVFADLIGAAMSEVNWHEIADHMLADMLAEA